jgi:hypothetical protein
VLRCHLALVVPDSQRCGLWVDGVQQLHETGKIIVFDDSKIHKAFNVRKGENDSDSDSGDERPNTTDGSADRIVLIVDLMRPSHIPLGNATGGHTAELDTFISAFH